MILVAFGGGLLGFAWVWKFHTGVEVELYMCVFFLLRRVVVGSPSYSEIAIVRVYSYGFAGMG
jgi:hypothetical protein